MENKPTSSTNKQLQQQHQQQPPPRSSPPRTNNKRSRSPSSEEIGRHGHGGGSVAGQIGDRPETKEHENNGNNNGDNGNNSKELDDQENNGNVATDAEAAGENQDEQGETLAAESARQKRRLFQSQEEEEEEEEEERNKESNSESNGDNTSFSAESSAPKISSPLRTNATAITTTTTHLLRPTQPTRKLKKLRLEGIFHPKFENETSDKDVRKEMLSRMEMGEGYLEVSLKHSGSLLLWSGGSRYYSKNSANNAVTLVGEFLLRQHMALLWSPTPADSADSHVNNNYSTMTNNTTKATTAATANYHYGQCSNYLQHHRLTLAFEVVTSSILGDHGDAPKRPYLLLLSVANRNHQTFYTSHQLMALAQKFRLPHNDYWIFTSAKSAERVFRFYDDVREMGTADVVIKGLDQLVDGLWDDENGNGHGGGAVNGVSSGVGGKGEKQRIRRIVSMYPHMDYQGSILEGLVIRFVPYNKQESLINDLSLTAAEELMPQGTDGAERENCCRDDFLRSLADFAICSKKHLDIATSATIAKDALLPTTQGILSKSLQDFCSADLKESETSLRKFLESQSGSQRSQQLALIRGIENAKDWDIFAWIHDWIDTNSNQSNADEETKHIVQLIETLQKMKARVDYKLFREGVEGDTREEGIDGQFVEKTRSRYICMIHVVHDASFKKYNAIMSPGDMKLFRGFSFQFVFEGDEDPDKRDESCIMSDEHREISQSEIANDKDARPLMLKMKFLPYMVRTFGCRNGLKVLSQSGVDGYERYTLGMLQKWGMSHGAIKKWQPYFYHWGVYAKDVLDKQQKQKQKHNNQHTMPAGDDGQPPPLPWLSERDYLAHLANFENLHKNGKYTSSRINTASSNGNVECRFKGLIVVVGLTKDISAAFSDYLAEKLGVQQQVSDMCQITEAEVLSSLHEDGRGGIVCNISVEEVKKPLMALTKKKQYTEAIQIVLVGCGEQEINSRYEIGGKDNKRITGIAGSWKRLRCKFIYDLPALSTFLEVSDSGVPAKVCECKETENLVTELLKVSDALPSRDNRPGLLVFFPGIPGCGKSSLCGGNTQESILDVVTSASNEMLGSRSKDQSIKEATPNKRTITICEGDNVKGKYWPQVLKLRLESSSSIFVADKNATPTSWDIISEVCDKSQALPLPVLPDSMALSTVIVGTELLESLGHVMQQCCYPFSLSYLAVCMLRVLARPSGSHVGKLDRKTENACMIVVKFYCLYRGISAEAMASMIHDKMLSSPENKNAAITIPFFKQGCYQELPLDLRDCLMEALLLQHSIDCKKVESINESTLAMEKRLRELLLLHQNTLESMCAPEIESRESFLRQVAAYTMNVDSIFQSKSGIEQATVHRFIEIVSVDVDVKVIHGLVEKLASKNADVGRFLESKERLPMINGNRDNMPQEVQELPKEGCGTFVEKTHVTMAHFSQLSQQKLREMYGHLDGHPVDVSITDLVIGETVVAFSIVIPGKSKSRPPCDIPPIQNSYPHITIWFGEGESAARSNDLPAMVERGEAIRVALDETVTVPGTFGYWYI